MSVPHRVGHDHTVVGEVRLPRRAVQPLHKPDSLRIRLSLRLHTQTSSACRSFLIFRQPSPWKVDPRSHGGRARQSAHRCALASVPADTAGDLQRQPRGDGGSWWLSRRSRHGRRRRRRRAFLLRAIWYGSFCRPPQKGVPFSSLPIFFPRSSFSTVVFPMITVSRAISSSCGMSSRA